MSWESWENSRLHVLARTAMLRLGSKGEDDCWSYDDGQVMIMGDGFAIVVWVGYHRGHGFVTVYRFIEGIKNDVLVAETVEHLERVLVLEELATDDQLSQSNGPAT
jgi:hypothetical protein